MLNLGCQLGPAGLELLRELEVVQGEVSHHSVHGRGLGMPEPIDLAHQSRGHLLQGLAGAPLCRGGFGSGPGSAKAGIPSALLPLERCFARAVLVGEDMQGPGLVPLMEGDLHGADEPQVLADLVLEPAQVALPLFDQQHLPHRAAG